MSEEPVPVPDKGGWIDGETGEYAFGGPPPEPPDPPDPPITRKEPDEPKAPSVPRKTEK